MLDELTGTDLAPGNDVSPTAFEGFQECRRRSHSEGIDIHDILSPKRRKSKEEGSQDGDLSQIADYLLNGLEEPSTSTVDTSSLKGKGISGVKVTKQRVVQFLSYDQLVFLALKNANFSSLTIGQVYGFLESTFSCFHPNDTYWRANVERAVTVGKILKMFDTNLTPRSVDVVSATVKMREDAISEMEQKVEEWMSQFGDHNIEESRFSSLEEMLLVCQGAMGFLPPPAGTPDNSEELSERDQSASSDESDRDFEADSKKLVMSQRIRTRSSWAPRKFPCRNCRVGNRALRQHLREVHGFSEAVIDEYKANLKKRKRKGTRYIGVDCPKCNAYISVKYLKLHLWNIHGMTDDAIAIHREKIAKMHMGELSDVWKKRKKLKCGVESSDEEESSGEEKEEEESEEGVPQVAEAQEVEAAGRSSPGQLDLLANFADPLQMFAFNRVGGRMGWTNCGNKGKYRRDVFAEEGLDLLFKELPAVEPDNAIPSPPSIEPPFCQPSVSPSHSIYQPQVIPSEGINVLALLEEDHEIPQIPLMGEENAEEMDMKPDKEALDAEMDLGIVRKKKTYILPPQNVYRPPPGHCMVCSKRIGRKALSRHLRLQHGFSDEDVLQYMLSDEERSLSCPGCTRMFKSQLSLRQHNRWCPPPGNIQMHIPQPEDVKPVVEAQGTLLNLFNQ